jgi:signal transduction histidine kinase
MLAQMVVLVLLALVLAQGISVWILASAHRNVLAATNERFAIRQFASMVHLLEQTPPELHRRLLKVWRHPGRQFGFMQEPPLDSTAPDSAAEQRLEQVMVRVLGAQYQGRIQVAVELQPRRKESYSESHDKHDEEEHRFHRPRHPHRDPRWWKERGFKLKRLLLAVHLDDGRWFYCHYAAPQIIGLAARQPLISVAIASVLVLMVVFWQLRKITRPLRALRSASDAMGRGQSVESVEETGPSDLRQTIAAFNEMNERVQRFVSDRTRMLAALSHDLRTPITSMRLRLEMMEPGEQRDKLLASLDEMQQMSEATLAFVRHADDGEEACKVNLAALLSSLCDDLSDLGMAVSLADVQEQVAEVRPVSLKRALRNVIENAVHYGREAYVRMQRHDKDIVIEVEDRGPGIPEDRLQDVFEPFVRLEESRNRDTGGMGLGLSIARQILIRHGGDIELRNTGQGLLVRMTIPA